MFGSRNLLPLFCLALGMSPVRASVLAEHLGDSAPDSGTDRSPWEKVFEGNVSEEPASGDVPAWRVVDRGNGVIYYKLSPENADVSPMEGREWKLSAKLQVDRSDTPSHPFAVTVEYADAKLGLRYAVGFSATHSGELTVTVNGAADSITLNESEAAGFRLYELVFDPGSQQAKLLVDGVERLDAIRPLKNSTLSRIIWGCGATKGNGAADFHLVRLESMP